ncbi:MAG TPA: AI-2E family transporter [Longimicrobiales bacterium]|nr:AI-2E family transporter [Longimicrobiales bacterium]
MSEELNVDRRREDRRSDFIPLAEYTVPELRKALVTAFVVLAVTALFVYMVAPVLVAAVAGVVVGAYLLPLERWLERRIGSRKLAAVVTILAVTIPVVAMLVYSWVEISDAAKYLDQHRNEVAAGISAGLRRIPFTESIQTPDVGNFIAKASAKAGKQADEIQEAASIIGVSVAVAIFTIYYILTDSPSIIRYLATKVPGRYRELTDEMSRNIKAVVYGALYGTFITQLAKSVIVLLMNLAFQVPLAIILAFISFFIGLFPVVGSWAVYIPVGIYLMVWRGDVWQGVTVILVGLLVNTIFMSMYVRPKLAAEKSHVLNFYWMVIALITGVYTFGLVGIIIGPVLIAVLRAVFDTITGEAPPPLLGPRAGEAAPRPSAPRG